MECAEAASSFRVRRLLWDGWEALGELVQHQAYTMHISTHLQCDQAGQGAKGRFSSFSAAGPSTHHQLHQPRPMQGPRPYAVDVQSLSDVHRRDVVQKSTMCMRLSAHGNYIKFQIQLPMWNRFNGSGKNCCCHVRAMVSTAHNNNRPHGETV